MKKLDITIKDNKKSIIYMLLAAKERGEKVYAEYNGQVFYSDIVTMSDIYHDIVLNNKKSYVSNSEEQDNDSAIRKVPEWISEGQVLIRSSKFAFWQETVMKRSIDLYKGKDLEVFLDIMRNMRDGVCMDDIVSSYMKAGYSEVFRAFVNFLIKEFSDKSEEFFKIYDAQRAMPKNVNWNAYNPSLKPHKKRVRSKGKE